MHPIDSSEDSYLEIMRLALGLKLYVLTGWTWHVSLAVDNLDFQFGFRQGTFHIRSESMDIRALEPESIAWMPVRIETISHYILESWLKSLRIF